MASKDVTSLTPTNSKMCLRWSGARSIKLYEVLPLVDESMFSEFILLYICMNKKRNVLTLQRIVTNTTIISYSSVVMAIRVKLSQKQEVGIQMQTHMQQTNNFLFINDYHQHSNYSFKWLVTNWNKNLIISNTTHLNQHSKRTWTVNTHFMDVYCICYLLNNFWMGWKLTNLTETRENSNWITSKYFRRNNQLPAPLSNSLFPAETKKTKINRNTLKTTTTKHPGSTVITESPVEILIEIRISLTVFYSMSDRPPLPEHLNCSPTKKNGFIRRWLQCEYNESMDRSCHHRRWYGKFSNSTYLGFVLTDRGCWRMEYEQFLFIQWHDVIFYILEGCNVILTHSRIPFL